VTFLLASRAPYLSQNLLLGDNSLCILNQKVQELVFDWTEMDFLIVNADCHEQSNFAAIEQSNFAGLRQS
jgi:hypothetical protein